MNNFNQTLFYFQLLDSYENCLADVIQLPNNKVIASWRGEKQSIVIWDSMHDFLSISLHSERKLKEIPLFHCCGK